MNTFVIAGDIFTGFRLYGPFASEEAATTWGDARITLKGATAWWIIDARDPDLIRELPENLRNTKEPT